MVGGGILVFFASTLLAQSSGTEQSVFVKGVPISTLVTDLSSKEGTRRIAAAAELRERVHSCFSPTCDELFGDKPTELRRLRLEIRPMIPLLSELIHSSDDEVSMASLEALTAAGITAKAAATQIRCLLRNTDVSAEKWQIAFVAILFVTPEHEPVVPILVKELKRLRSDGLTWDDADPNLGFATDSISYLLASLLYTSGHTKSEISSIVEAASSETSLAWRVIAIKVLGALESEAISAIPSLRHMLDDDDDERIRRLAANSLLMVIGDSSLNAHIGDRLQLNDEERASLQSKTSMMLRERRNRLARLSRNADSIADAVLWIEYGRGPLQRDALRVLRNYGMSDPDAIMATRQLLHNLDAETRALARQVLINMGESVLNVDEHRTKGACRRRLRVLFKIEVGRRRTTKAIAW